MNSRRACAYLMAALIATTAMSADQGTAAEEQNKAREAASERSAQSETPSRDSCAKQCVAAEARCSSDVRRARQRCSKNAANGGRDPFTGSGERDPFTGRDDRDPFTGRNTYAYFCDYFAHPARSCGTGPYSDRCQARLAQRYAQCADAMQNIAALRYDCIRTERDAQNFCRDELRDCQASCK